MYAQLVLSEYLALAGCWGQRYRQDEDKPGGGNVTEFTAHGRFQAETGPLRIEQGTPPGWRMRAPQKRWWARRLRIHQDDARQEFALDKLSRKSREH